MLRRLSLLSNTTNAAALPTLYTTQIIDQCQRGDSNPRRFGSPITQYRHRLPSPTTLPVDYENSPTILYLGVSLITRAYKWDVKPNIAGMHLRLLVYNTVKMVIQAA